MSKRRAGKVGTTTTVGWSFLWVIFFGLVFAGVGAYAVYKYRLRVKQLRLSQSPLYPLVFTCKRSHVGLDLLVNTMMVIHLVPAWTKSSLLFVIRATWIRRSAPSWLSTCPWITKKEQTSSIMSRMRMIFETALLFWSSIGWACSISPVLPHRCTSDFAEVN